MRNHELKVLLAQDSGFDNLACLSRQLEIAGYKPEFIWPFEEGPLQGNIEIAKRNLFYYCPNLELRTFKSRSDWQQFSDRAIRRKSTIFAQTPYINEHYSQSSKELLAQTSTGYINYGINITADYSYNYDLDVYKTFRPLLVANDEEKTLYVNRGATPENVVVTGMAGPFEVRSRINGAIASSSTHRMQILWAPHWSDRWSTWELVLPQIYALASNNRNIDLILRPHPLLRAFTQRHLPPGYHDSTGRSPKSTQLINNLLALDNVQLSEATMVEDCFRADICVTDGIAIIAYWAATGKPLGITRKVDSPQFSSQFIKIGAESSLIDTSNELGISTWVESNEGIFHTTKGQVPINQKLIGASYTYYDPKESPGCKLTTWIRRNRVESHAFKFRGLLNNIKLRSLILTSYVALVQDYGVQAT